MYYCQLSAKYIRKEVKNMVNVERKNELIKAFQDCAKQNFETTCSDLEMVKFMKEKEVGLVKECVVKIKNNVLAAIPEGVAIPRISIYQTLTGQDEVDVLTITVTNCLNGEKKFKFKFTVAQNKVTIRVRDFFIMVYTELLKDSLMEQNLERVNEVLELAAKEANLPYAIKVVTPMNNEGKKIAMMTDNEIQFVADEDRIFAFEDILVLQEEGELITEEMLQDAFRHEVECIEVAHTPEQLVEQYGGSLVTYVCDISTLVKPMTYIKKITNKNIMNYKGNKDAILYYLKDNVFALFAKRDGNVEQILSPFDITTLRKVDVDVLGSIEM